MLCGHPPVLYLVHGALYQFFGSPIWPHRVAALFFAALGVWYTFRLGTFICNRSTGVCAAILLFASPMFFAQSPMVLGDLPIASLGVVSLYYLFAERRFAYAVTATLLLQTKETALAISVAAALYWFFRRPKDVYDAKSIAMHAVPIGSLAAFFGLEYMSTGTFVQVPGFQGRFPFIVNWSDPAEAIARILDAARWVGRVIFIGEGRILLTGMILLARRISPSSAASW